MIESDKTKFHAMINLAFELAGKDKPERHLVKGYFVALEKYDIEEISQALNRHAVDPDQGQWVPKIADIVRNITGNTQTQSELAWTKVDTAIRTVGPHESVCFDDKTIHAVIEDMGGWILLCGIDNDEYPFKHNEFIKRYRGYAVRPPGQVMKRLIGSNEAGCANWPDKIAPPVLVGDRDKALLILESGREEKRETLHRPGGLLGDMVKKITGGSDSE